MSSAVFRIPEARFLVALVRTQGVLTSVLLAAALVLVGCVVAGELVAVPGLTHSVPAVRVFPALLAAVGAVLLRVDWRPYEHVGAHSLVLLRVARLLVGAAISGVGGAVLAEASGTPLIAALTLTLFVALVLAITVLGELWWAVVPAVLYLQLFREQIADLQPPAPVVVVLAVLAAGLYLCRNLLPE